MWGLVHFRWGFLSFWTAPAPPRLLRMPPPLLHRHCQRFALESTNPPVVLMVEMHAFGSSNFSFFLVCVPLMGLDTSEHTNGSTCQIKCSTCCIGWKCCNEVFPCSLIVDAYAMVLLTHVSLSSFLLGGKLGNWRRHIFVVCFHEGDLSPSPSTFFFRTRWDWIRAYTRRASAIQNLAQPCPSATQSSCRAVHDDVGALNSAPAEHRLLFDGCHSG